ncbi:MAG TPA: type II secretion system protein GspG [Verrucomicrobiae bacterium]|nr:type II secretion system protein GspG [Verrucomicrobiae bacterium]
MDIFSDCIYLGTSGIPHEVTAYEREKDGNTNREKLTIIFPHGGGTHVTKQELDDLLSTNDCALLEYFRKEQVTYYEANLHASLNFYRIDFGSYPRGDNASVTKVLCGDNPKKEQYHSSYKQERNSNGEDLDPWGTPHLIKSDGNKVQIKSAGRNRAFDQIGSTNYDDICFSIANGSVIGDDTKF